MRIELRDCNGQAYRCDSRDPGTIGRWFAEYAELLMSADSRMMPYPLYIWPQDHREQEILSGPLRMQAIEARMTQDGLLELARVILAAAERLGEKERAEPVDDGAMAP